MEISISKKYQDVVIFNNFTASFKENKINVILGPSGCGKTTLLHCIANLTDYEGTITNENKSLSYVFQEDRLFPYLTIRKNLLIINNNEIVVNRFLKQFNVFDLKNKYPNQLSGGEKQRIAIIRAFLNENSLVLMDEPFKSLDYNLKINLVDVVLKLHSNTKNTIILVTHDLDVALYLGHYITVLSSKVTKVLETFSNPFFGQEITEDSVVIRNKLKKLLCEK